MTRVRADIIDRRSEKAHVWLDEVATELDTEDRQTAYRALRDVVAAGALAEPMRALLR